MSNPHDKPDESPVSREFQELTEKFFPDGFTLRDEANAIVAKAFRNGPLEDLHAGKCSELLEDDTLSRITDDEMKTLMIFASEQVAKLLNLKETAPEEYWREMIVFSNMYCREWER